MVCKVIFRVDLPESMLLIERDVGQKSMINIKDPNIRAITLKATRIDTITQKKNYQYKSYAIVEEKNIKLKNFHQLGSENSSTSNPSTNYSILQ